MTQRALGAGVGSPQSHVSKTEQGVVDLQLSSLAAADEPTGRIDLPVLMVGTIIGHAHPHSTAIYAHIDHEPAKVAAGHATTGITSALSRNSTSAMSKKQKDTAASVVAISEGRVPDALMNALIAAVEYDKANTGRGALLLQDLNQLEMPPSAPKQLLGSATA